MLKKLDMKLFPKRSQLLFCLIILIFKNYEISAQNQIQAKELSKKEIQDLKKEKAFEKKNVIREED